MSIVHREYKYSIVGLVDGQLYESKDNTFEEFKRIFDMIYDVGGFVIEYTMEEIMGARAVFGT